MQAKIIELLISLPAVIIALGFHEASHAFMAYKMGDNTAKNLGRLTINPIKHIDPIGFLCLFLVHFGWAKPVPINPRNFKNPKRGTVLVALAGPLSNIALGFVFTLIYVALGQFGIGATTIGNLAMQMLAACISVNLSLGIFNLIPIPPLDGAKIFGGLLPKKLYFWIMDYEQYISIILMILLLFTNVIGYIIFPIVSLLESIFFFASNLIVSIIAIGIYYIIDLFN